MTSYNNALAKFCKTDLMVFGFLLFQGQPSQPRERHMRIHQRQYFDCSILGACLALFLIVLFQVTAYWLLLTFFMYYILIAIEACVSAMAQWLQGGHVYKTDKEATFVSAMELEALQNQQSEAYIQSYKDFGFISYYKYIVLLGVKWQKQGFYYKTIRSKDLLK